MLMCPVIPKAEKREGNLSREELPELPELPLTDLASGRAEGMWQEANHVSETGRAADCPSPCWKLEAAVTFCHLSLCRGDGASLLSPGDSWIDLVWLALCFSTLENWKIAPKS